MWRGRRAMPAAGQPSLLPAQRQCNKGPAGKDGRQHLLSLLPHALDGGRWTVDGGRPGGWGFDLSWSTIDGGRSTFSTGGQYTLGGTKGRGDILPYTSLVGG